MSKQLPIAVNISLAFLIALGNAPLSLALEATTPPVIVMPRISNLVQNIDSSNHALINQGRVNRDDEVTVRQLINENDLLTQALCERQRTVLQLRQQMIGDKGAFNGSTTACGTFSAINQGLQTYSNQVVERDRQMIAQNSKAAGAPQYTASSQEVMDLAREVAEMKNSKPVAVSVVQETAPIVVNANPKALQEVEDRLSSKLGLLEEKIKAMQDKGLALQEFKSQVVDVNSQLRSANSQYDGLIQSYNDAIQQLKARWAAERDSQGSLQAAHVADQSLIKQLQDQNARLNQDLEKAKAIKPYDDELKNKFDSQQASLGDVNKTLEAKEKKIEELTRQWYGKDGLLLELKNKLTASDAKLAVISDALKLKDNEIASLKDELNKFKTALRDSQQQLTEAQAMVKDKEGVIALQRKAMDGLRLDVTTLTQQGDAAKKQLADQQQAYAQVQQNVAALKEALSHQKSDLAAKGEKIAQLNLELAQAKLHVSNNDVSAAEGTAMIMQLRDQAAGLKNDFANRDLSLSKLEDMVAQLRAQESDLRRQLDAKDASMAEMGSSLKDKEGKIKQLTDKLGMINDLKANIDAKDAALKKQNDKIVEIADQMKIIGELKKDIGSKEEELKNQNTKVAVLNESLVKALSIASQTNAQLKQIDELTLKVGQLADKIHGKDYAISQRDATLRQKDEMLSKSQEEKTQLLKALSDLQVKSEQLTVRLAQAQELSGKQQEQIELLGQKMNLSKDQRADYEYQVDKLEARVKDIAARQMDTTGRYQDELAYLKKELMGKEDELNALRAELKKKVDESTQLSAILDGYEEKLKNVNGKYELELQETLTAKKHQAELEAQIAQLSETIAMKDEQIKKLKSYFIELERRYSAKDQDIKAKDLSLSMMQSLIDQNAKENDNKIQEISKQVQAKDEELKGLREQLAFNEAKLNGAVNKDEAARWKVDVDAARAEVTKLTAQLKEKETLLAQVKAESEVRAKEFADQLTEIDGLKTELNKAQDRLMKASVDMEYKQKEVIRLKGISKAKEAQLKRIADEAIEGRQHEVAVLVEKLKAAENKLKAIHGLHQTVVPQAKESPAPVVKALAGNQELVFLRDDLKAMSAKLTEALNKIQEQAGKEGQYQQEILALKKRLKDSQGSLQDASASGDVASLRSALADAREEIRATKEEMEQYKKLSAQLNEKLNTKK